MALRFDVTSVGELLIRLSVRAGERMELAQQFDASPAGAEANVLSVLSRLGRRCGWLGALPDNALGRLGANHLRMAGVNLDAVVWESEGRMGTYFVEFAIPPRPIQVIYDRENSSMTRLEIERIDWDYLLDTRLVHLTGITPSLSPACRHVVERAIERAKSAGIPISFDVNYREKLWSPDEAAQVLSLLIRDADLLFCTERDAKSVFGCSGTPMEIVRNLADLSGARAVVMSRGEHGAVAWTENSYINQPGQETQVIDRLGAGDALAAGVIHGWLNHDLARGLLYGVTLATMALGQHGDFVVATAKELEDATCQQADRIIR